MTDPQIARHLAAAATAEAAGDAACATREYRAALTLAPADPQALNGLGLLLLYAGDAAQATALLSAATRADPHAAMLWLNLSSAHRASGDTGGERAALAAAIDLDPYALPALVRKAQLHERLDEAALATAAWRTVLAAVPPEAQQPPALREIVAHARTVTSATDARFASALTRGLDDALAPFDAAQRRRFDASVDHVLGRRRIYTSQCAGLHFPFLPADEFHDAARFPWFADFEAHTAAIRAEFEALIAGGGDGIQAYVDKPSGARANVWTELNRSTRWGAYYFYRYGVRDEAACAACPATAAAIDALPLVDIPGRAPTAFFSILEPCTRIPPHTGVTNTRVTVHLPLIVPPGCAFRVGGETREWVEGRAFAFDDTIEHEARNDSEQLRAVLIVDVWNPYLTDPERAMTRAFYAAADATGLNPEALPAA